MKYNIQNLALLSAVISFASCGQHKQATIDESGNEVIKIRQPSEDTGTTAGGLGDTIVKPIEKEAVPASIEEKPLKDNDNNKPTDNIGKKPAPAVTFKGVVKSINTGKDGYTAKVQTADGQMVAVTVSRSNLTNPKQYKMVAVGDVVKVTGESWKLDGETQLTVREIN